jgi:peptidoglycan/xylan/chitin deacetylase (PgdA/CDA1 family)
VKFVFGLFFISVFVFSKEIALTFDDAPRNSSYFSGLKRTTKLIQQLKDEKVSTVFFCNSARNDEDSGLLRLKLYGREGHLIANHTHGHPDFDKLSVENFTKNFEEADNQLSKLPNYIKWFRFPFLHEGNTVEKRDQFRKILKDRGYLNGYVTVDTYDWYLDKLFQEANNAKKKIDFDKLRDLYVKVLLEDSEFFDNISVKGLGRSVKHVLLLHENDLAAMFIGDLIKALRKNGWKIISPKEAYTDAIASVEPDTLFLGQGRVAAIAKLNGYKGSFRNWDDEDKLDKLFADEKVFK